MAEANVRLRVDANQAVSSLRKVNNLVGQLGVALGAADLARRFFKGFAEADKAAAAVSTLGVNAQKLKAELLALSNEQKGLIGQTELLAASYDVASAGFNSAAEATNVLRASSLGAVGGLSDLNTVANATTSVLNAYGLSSDKAQKLVDGFIQTQNDGKIIVGQYATQIGRVAPIAAAAGVGIGELNAAISAVTATGVPVESTFAGLRQVIAAVIKPTKEASDRAKEIGLQFDTAAIKTKGFGGFLEDLIKKTGGSEVEITKLFGSVEAVAAIMPLVNDRLEKFNQSLENQENSAGVAAKATEKMGNTINGQITKISNNVGNLARTFDEGLGPAIKDLLTPVNALLVETVNLFKAIPPEVVTFTTRIVALTASFVILRKVAMLTFLAKLPRLIKRVNGGLVGARLATLKLRTAFLALKTAAPFGIFLVVLDQVISKLGEAKQAQEDFNGLVREGGKAQLRSEIFTQQNTVTQLENRVSRLNPQQAKRQGLDRQLLEAQNKLQRLQGALSVAELQLASRPQPLEREDTSNGNGNGSGVTGDQKRVDMSQKMLDLVRQRQELAKGENKVALAVKDNEIERLRIQEDSLGPRQKIADLGKAETTLYNELRQIHGENLQSFVDQKNMAEQAGKALADGYLKHVKELNEEIAEAAKPMNDLYKSIGQSIETGIVDSLTAAVDGTKKLADVAADTLRNIANILLQFGVNAALGGLGQAAGPGSILARMFPARANGGSVKGGRSYMVGEKGPELFTPSRSGSIAPSGSFGGANVTVNVDASGTQAQGNQPNAKLLGQAIGAAVQAELIKQKRPGGLLTV